ncbi:thyrotropin-releasing hormone-degrading ectoenzyme-like [Odontomachus brunneus]|uniref:thyrotropin-releasing hormone-degrading ectoenzyme-like n=1 Tax=Odontomachus brunneus TaxID=486640 RepID=UPI0013F201C4|nr:thyrotropin-releasing hormone-degrading ectoenzyme-like [Odontomachus brunneus]XP_032687708.1 thyrotropin-releasing hormone-degrading ectoenzyme-like [Odontomachus brunneus]
MRLILFLGVVLKFIVPIAGVIYARNIISMCSSISGNLNISEVMPIKYDIHIRIKPRQRVLSGYMNILINVTKPIRNIILHAKSTYDYEIEDKWDRISLSGFQFCEREEILILQLNKTLDKGKYKFQLAYRSILNKNVEKIFYPTTWTSKNQNWMLTNLYTPNAIRTIFPCWDDPRIEATYNITIQTSGDYVVLSNIPENSIFYTHDSLLKEDFGRRLAMYKKFVSMPTHLIALLVTNDISKDFKTSDMHYMWRKTGANKKFTYILEKAEMVTSFFTKYMRINSSYFFPKINHVVLPNSPMKSMGAPGLIVYRERDVTYDALSDFPGRLVAATMLVTYEMARQLFVGVVSPQLGNDYVWLNEIFASFCGYYVMDKIWTSDRLMELFVVKIIQPTLNSDMLIEREPIISKAKNSNGIDGLLYPLLYHKKAFALIRMLLQLYNPNVFNEAIRKYVHERTNDIWTVLEEVYPLRDRGSRTVNQIMNTWLTGKHHPELLAERNYKQETVSFLSLATLLDENEWIIPVNYITASTFDFYNISHIFWLHWSNMNNTIITKFDEFYNTMDSFYIFNAEQTGYYRINYDDKNWRMISTYMEENDIANIPPLTRAQLVNDAYYFTTIRELKGSTFVEIIRHLQWDGDFIAWYPMFNILTDMSSYFKFPESNRIKDHFLRLLGGVLTRMGYYDFIRDDKMEKSLRHLVRRWACKLGHSECRSTALNHLMMYIKYGDELGRIPAELKEWIICDGLKTEDLNVWKNILNKTVDYNSEVLLGYLSCTENSTIIVHYLSLMLRTIYFWRTEQSMGPICRKIVKNHIGNNVVLRFVIENYNMIISRFPDEFPSASLLSDMIMNVYSLKDLDMIRVFANKLFFPTTEGFSRLLESINLLIRYRTKYLIKVQNKFKEFNLKIE